MRVKPQHEISVQYEGAGDMHVRNFDFSRAFFSSGGLGFELRTSC
jgi:hypothetical protein